ncbi:DsrE/DsrF/TusD sulfur relay family protein [Vibrio parahaemolyticus]|uniref:DsrE/DsrF/TusD sulfur relay family protein n=1 Tax=Vibrio parahaemolyticus TaxID=670 RepID=UPI00387A9DB0
MQSQNIVMTLSGSPYGSEALFNALRLAIALKEQDDHTVNLKLFLMSDSVFGALKGQVTPDFSYNIGQMLEVLLAQKVSVLLCKTCISARGITMSQVIDDVAIGTMADLSQWVLWADKVIAM